MTSSRSFPLHIAFLIASLVALSGFLMPLTTHALPPSEAEIDDGGDGGGGGGGGDEGYTTPTVSITASPSSIQSGYSSQLSFNSSGVTRCVIDNGIGAVSSNIGGTRVVSPTQSTTYRISCDAPLEVVTDEVIVNVAPAPTPLTAYCEAGPDTAQINETVQWSATHSTGSSSGLVWQQGASFTTKICSGGQNYQSLNRTCSDDVMNGDACSVEGQRCRQSAGCDGDTYTDGEGQPNAHTQYGSVTPFTCVASGPSNATYSYAWTGTDGLTGATQAVSKAYATAGEKTGRATVTRSTGGSASASCTAQISPRTPTATLTANPSSITAGSPSTLTWSSTNANACTLNESIGSVSTSGTRSVSPGSTTTYTLMCTAPSTAVSGTWQYRGSDISDFACVQPGNNITDTNKAYSSVPNCPSNPQGKACSTTGACKVNTVQGCNIHTDIYECSGSSSSPAQSATASATVTVTATPTLPDLTAGSISPTTARTGQATSLSGTVTNIGGAVAPASNTYFRILNSGGKQVYQNTVNIPAVQPGSGDTRSIAYTFTAEGTYQAQVCGDWFGSVTESNEGNNCGPLTPISVTSIVNANTVSCSVNNTSINPGGSVTYSATPSGSATSPYTWVANDGATGFGSGATATRTFTAAGNYGMQVSATGATAPAQCPVVSVAACVGTPTAEITATPARVRSGGTTTLRWTASAINTSCTITGPGVSQTVSAASCTVPEGTTGSGTITTQSTYTISCDNGEITDSIIVNVIPEFEEF
ncbi:hypothetical protein KJ819_00365 [Patescibacteria group bacterium]|nr:hypothetical protein [Patescibacteria group bacterium]MBU1501089.1 hypothetical protein [Patescibacteria group bacterium]MBU2081038.1 hypothetical protein [Patescibacteria group bacterium]MBU2124129.1 hypothetical protein [Patescibacteria group bacterium]MBU2194985.1 hypothetical protein [Patescibacteria group bacterium]